MPAEPPVPPHALAAAHARTSVADWVEYFRDLGIHDFYRLGDASSRRAAEPATVEANTSAGTDSVTDLSTWQTRGLPQGRPATASRAEETAHGPVVIPDALRSQAPPAPQSTPSQAQTVPTPLSFDQLAPPPAALIPAAERPAALRALQEEIGDCTRCPLAYAGRRTIVFADGSPTARLMFIGEGPGADEDTQGIPFVGKAGQLLNNMITAMGLAREQVYIANIVKCRPPANRVPEPVEANTCSPFLLRQIDIVRPEIVVALGATAATYLLGVKQSLASLRGTWHTCRGARVAVTYHPAFLLRDPRMKAEAWKDLQMVMKELGLKPPPRKA